MYRLSPAYRSAIATAAVPTALLSGWSEPTWSGRGTWIVCPPEFERQPQRRLAARDLLDLGEHAGKDARLNRRRRHSRCTLRSPDSCRTLGRKRTCRRRRGQGISPVLPQVLHQGITGPSSARSGSRARPRPRCRRAASSRYLPKPLPELPVQLRERRVVERGVAGLVVAEAGHPGMERPEVGDTDRARLVQLPPERPPGRGLRGYPSACPSPSRRATSRRRRRARASPSAPRCRRRSEPASPTWRRRSRSCRQIHAASAESRLSRTTPSQ